MKLIILIVTLIFVSISADGQKRVKKPAVKSAPKVAAKKAPAKKAPVKKTVAKAPVRIHPKVQVKTVGSSVLEFSNKRYILLRPMCEDKTTVVTRLYGDSLVNFRIKLMTTKVSHEVKPGEWKELDPKDKGMAFGDRFDLNLMIMLRDQFKPTALEIIPGTELEPTMIIMEKPGLVFLDVEKLLMFFKNYYGDMAQVNQTQPECYTLSR